MRQTNADLEWVTEILAAPSARVAMARRGDSRGARNGGGTFAVFPTAARPRLLVPLASKKAAARSLRGYSYPARTYMRVARALFGIGIRAGVSQHLLRDRLAISVGDEGSASVRSQLLLNEHLGEIFGRDVEIAVRIGPARPNRKPLVQVLSREGDVLGYAKAGWNDLTRALVRNEASILRDLDRRRGDFQFDIPRVIHFGRWRDLEVLVVSPLNGRSLQRGPLPLSLVLAATRDVAALSPTAHEALKDSRYWREARERLTRVENERPLGSIADLIEERYGDEVVALGSWHGDWAPWNMALRPGKLGIWDWERSGRVVPVGLDAVHFDFHVALRAASNDAVEAVRRTLAREGALLNALALPRRLERLLLSLHLLEMSLRWEEGRLAGMDVVDSTYLPALERILSAPASYLP